MVKHHTKYPGDAFAPAWKVFEFFTFGQTFKFFSNLKNVELKKKIAGVYGFRDVSLLNNYFISIINMINIYFTMSFQLILAQNFLNTGAKL